MYNDEILMKIQETMKMIPTSDNDPRTIFDPLEARQILEASLQARAINTSNILPEGSNYYYEDALSISAILFLENDILRECMFTLLHRIEELEKSVDGISQSLGSSMLSQSENPECCRT